MHYSFNLISVNTLKVDVGAREILFILSRFMLTVARQPISRIQLQVDVRSIDRQKGNDGVLTVGQRPQHVGRLARMQPQEGLEQRRMFHLRERLAQLFAAFAGKFRESGPSIL